MRIDTKLLDQVESENPNTTKSEAAEELRETISKIGKPGTKGQNIRCVVSVQMLTEGWDANNVTHILGLRAFTSQLLCEQVVGRGLRRMDYTPDPETGLFTEEYVDVYGIPFSIIPFRGRPTKKAAPEDKPKNEVRALPERKELEIRFPIVEGYAFALKQNLIEADIESMEPLIIEPDRTPTAVFVKAQVGIQKGGPTIGDGFESVSQDRKRYYEETHIQTIKFEIGRRIVWKLTEQASSNAVGKFKHQSRHQLFPQALNIVNEFVGRKIDWRGENQCELGLEKYVNLAVERLVAAIMPNQSQGESPLLPVLNRYKPIGSSADVYFKTTRAVHGTVKSHINQVVLDTQTWEKSASFRLEESKYVVSYTRNDHMEFSIPYEYQGVSHNFLPDFIVNLGNGLNLVLEIKGFQDDRVRAKHQAAKKWIEAINNWGKLGKWHFHVCADPQILGQEIEWLFNKTSDKNVALQDIPEISDISPQLLDLKDATFFETTSKEVTKISDKQQKPVNAEAATAETRLEPRQITIEQDKTGYCYESLFGDYVRGSKKLVLVDPYIRMSYQFRNLLKFVDAIKPEYTYLDFHLVTGAESLEQEVELSERFDALQGKLAVYKIRFTYTFDKRAHDRWIETDTGWKISLGRGLDFFQRAIDRFSPDWDDYSKRKCKATTITYLKT